VFVASCALALSVRPLHFLQTCACASMPLWPWAPRYCALLCAVCCCLVLIDMPSRQDKHSWITGRRPHPGECKKPLPFDLHYKPKLAFDGMIEAMAWTR